MSGGRSPAARASEDAHLLSPRVRSLTRSDSMMSRASTHIALGATLMVVAGCTTDRPAPTAAVLRAPIFEQRGGTDEMSGHEMRHLATDLRGRNEVPPNITPASGEAVFHVHNDGSVSYRLFVEDIRNPFMAHIHRGAAGAKGDVVA